MVQAVQQAIPWPRCCVIVFIREGCERSFRPRSSAMAHDELLVFFGPLAERIINRPTESANLGAYGLRVIVDETVSFSQ